MWATRIKNADGAVGATVLAAAFVVLALAVIGFRRWPVAGVAAVATVVVWLVRTPMILVDDQSVGFKVVHTVLAAVSFALSAWVLREVDIERKGEAAAAAAGLQDLADR